MSMLNEIQQSVTGAAVLRDWFGDGLHPVSQDQANTRSMACLHGNNGLECPNLAGANWLEQQIKNPIADAIKKQLETKNALKLETPMDKHPRLCRPCGCYMALKVWTPIEFIKAHTSEETVAKLPGWCWQRIEIENL